MATAKPATRQAAAKPKAAPAPVEEDEVEVEGAEFSDDDAGEGVVIDLDEESEGGGFEVLPRGIYNVVVSELTYEISQNSGQPMWALKLEVEDGDYAGNTLYTYLSFSPKARPRTVQTIKKCFGQLESPFNAQQVADEGVLEGTRLRARVDIRPYQGEKRNNVRALIPGLDAE
jgi:hypothetical protein